MLLGAGVLLVELVREFLQWCDLQFTHKVCTSSVCLERLFSRLISA
jgi:hypothetical protein